MDDFKSVSVIINYVYMRDWYIRCYSSSNRGHDWSCSGKTSNTAVWLDDDFCPFTYVTDISNVIHSLNRGHVWSCSGKTILIDHVQVRLYWKASC